MSLTDIKNKSQGFTIVELLIVVVVIAILAAITIVSYNGITNRANASAAQSTAASLQKKIELYQADEGKYPFALADMSTATDSGEAWYITNASLTPTGADPTSSTGKTRVKVAPCSGTATAPTASTTTGMRITWYDYQKTSPLTTIDLGTCTTTGTAWSGAAFS
jgi:prepilin-type N-terminal cleavage/methylation domain-containing protein